MSLGGGQQTGAPQPVQSVPGLQGPTGMQGETAAEQPLYLPSEDPIYDVYRNFLKVDKDNAAYLISDYGSSSGKTGPYYNRETTHTTLRFMLQISSDTRINYGKSFVMFDFIIGGTATPFPALCDPLYNGINPYASVYVLESASVKFNDFTTSPENYQSTNSLGRVIQCRLETKYDYNILNYAHDKLFTPLNQAPVRGSDASHVAATNVYKRTDRWRSTGANPADRATDVVRKYIPLGDIFGILDMRGIPNNITRVEFEFTLLPSTDPSLRADTTQTPPAAQAFTEVAVKDMRLLVSANRLSPVQHAESLQKKVSLRSERFAFLYGSSGNKNYTRGSLLPYMGVANLAVVVLRFPSVEVRRTAVDPNHGDIAVDYSQYESNGVYTYQIDYGGILFPQKTLSFLYDKYKSLPYKLAKLAFGKDGFSNFQFAIDHLYFEQNHFMLAAKFFDSTYPRITSSTEVKISLETEDVAASYKGMTCNMYYINWVYRTTIVGGDGTVVLQN